MDNLVSLGLCLFLIGLTDAYDLVRDTTNGKVLGTASSVTGVETYLGIPYASPPVGALRWKPPRPYPSWSSTGQIYNATHERPSCPQMGPSTYEVVGNEDCLFMNVYVPLAATFEAYPVMVFMHPGSFQTDGANSYDGTLLSRRGNVIVVTFNYRLGALGFLSTGDNQATGNYGLLDQKAVLEWVQENIKFFQGDSNRVTIFGSAAGGVSTLMQAISPSNQGDTQLFHRVIAQSGSPFSWWGFTSNPEYYAKQMMENAACPTYSTSIGLECLGKLDAADIVNFQHKNSGGSLSPWKPSVDGEILTDIPDIMTSDPNILAGSFERYEYLIGSTDFETAWDYDLIKDITDRDGFINYLTDKLAPHFKDSAKIAEVSAFNYIDPVHPPSTDVEWQLLAFNVSRDYMFLVPTLNMTYITSLESGLNSSSYYYLFAHKPGQGLVDAGRAYPSADIIDGATHLDDLAYVFGLPLTLPNVSSADRQISTQMITYWTNFAKTGNPSTGSEVDVEWPKYNWNSQQYLQFGSKDPDSNETVFVKDHLQSNEAVFWSRELGFYGEGKGFDDSVQIPPSNETASSPDETFEPIVETTKGAVRGLRIVREDYVLDRFLRVPFAKPPLGFLRFKNPEPLEVWGGILDATGNRSIVEWFNGCPIFNVIRNGSYGDEDCLFLNIYVPGGIDAKRSQQLPVMVWIYGGAYVWGRATGLRFYYDMERICNQGNVIGVTINYRLGPLGFLSTLDENAPGNAGFLDQVQALRWIRENIGAFGGDSSKVTIFGESAGAGSVAFHMVSPVSKDLFLRGISESGSIPAQWTISYDPLKQARRLAEVVGCPTDSNKLLVRCLQNKPVGAVMKGSLFNDYKSPKNNAWAGVVDGYFIPDDPVKLFQQSKDKDYLIGHNSMDGYLFASVDFLKITVDGLTMSRQDVETASTLFAPDVPEHVSEAVAFKYIDWEEPETGRVWPKIAIVNMYTDHMFVVPTYWNINERLSANGTGRTFMYRFSQMSRFGLYPEWKGADHTSELVYVFGHPFKGRNFSDADRKLSRAMMTHWTNFAWSGNPNYPNQGDIFAEWPEYNLETKYVIELNTSTATDPERYPHLLSNYRGEYIEFWTGLLKDLWTSPIQKCPASVVQLDNGNQKYIKSKSREKAVTCPEGPFIRATEGGCVEGYEFESNGAIIERYLSIPYAKPPVGDLRFRPPEAAELWEDVYEAKTYQKICPQYSVLDDTMSEDCLYLNIYVPQINATNAEGLPVMVWLHGGGFINGNGMEKLKGDTLAALGGVIVINFNYRLGSFGFMTTDDQYSPGNYGLLDQQFALTWVKNNIANFGGNPADVTIFGNSAGGQSVLLQSLSPMNQDLGITKAIMESASIISHDDLKQRDRAIRLAEEANCATNDNEAIVECLRSLDAADLLAAQAATGLKFEPTVDGELLPNHPREMAQESEVLKWTFIIGANDGDGSVRWGDVQTVTDEQRFHEVISLWFDEPYGWRTSIVDQHYADYNDLNFFNNETKMQIHLTEMFGDERYITPGLEIAEDYTIFGTDVYFYFFTYPHDRPDFYGFPSWAGAAHSSEFSFVFGDVINDDTQPEEVKDLSRRIIQYWSNFAKTGNPNEGYQDNDTPSLLWSTYKGRLATTELGSKNYIQLDLGEKTQMKEDLRPTEKALWLDHMVSEAQYCEVDLPTPTTTSPPTIDLENPRVMTSSGPIKGKRVQNNLMDVQSFLGIPYAAPPINALRFENAEPVPNWDDELRATSVKFPCIQFYHGADILGSEDCLYLDIHVPTGLLSTNSSSMPVLFWIHGDFDGDASYLGGSFWSGGGTPGWNLDAPNMDPSYISSVGNVVVIRPNFRLGPFGFLTTESEEMRGNYGLSDLRMALTWIYQNAKNFAADPNKITVIGQGSGAAAAELLGILPSTKHMVRRVIGLSGSAFAPWAFCTNNECEKIARTTAKLIGCSETTTADIKACIQGADQVDILSATQFKPITSEAEESNAWGTWRFFTDGDIIPNDVTLEELFASSNMDMISGIANEEFDSYLQITYPDYATSEGLLLQSIEDTQKFLTGSNVESWPNEIHSYLAHEYTNWEDRYNPILAFQSSKQYYNDLMFAVHSAKSISSNLGSKSNFQYIINRPLLRMGEMNLPLGARHGDDVLYTFGFPFLDDSLYSDEDREYSLSIMSYWINFAWNGDPNSDLSKQTWKKYTSNEQAYLEIDSSRSLPRAPTNYNIEKNSLWGDVVPVFSPQLVPEYSTTLLPSLATTQTVQRTTEKNDNCVEEFPPIGTGLGLNLTPEQADTAIYIMFSVCLVLGTLIFIILLQWVCAARVIKSKNRKTVSENHYNKDGSIKGLNTYNNLTFDNEEPKKGQISAL